MRVLLDTCAFLWFIGGSERLSRPARDLMEDCCDQAFPAYPVKPVW